MVAVNRLTMECGNFASLSVRGCCFRSAITKLAKRYTHRLCQSISEAACKNPYGRLTLSSNDGTATISSRSASLTSDNSHSQLNNNKCGVIVVGGGHAGVEAACAAARMGVRTALVTHKRSTLGEMSCNPSFGGIGKGHLMRELDALDGVAGVVCDKSGLQYRILNRSRGAAVWGYRAQIDRALYKQNMQHYLDNYEPNLRIMEAAVDDLVFQQPDDTNTGFLRTPKCIGVILSDGSFMQSDCVVITTGTFLSGEIHLGLQRWPAGRIGDEPALKLAASLKHAGFSIARLKTGTPPRLDAATIDYARTQAIGGDNPPLPFSFLHDRVWLDAKDQLPTYIAYTTQDVKQHVHASLDQNIHIKEETRGPRYCPSLESKVLRFGHLSHRLWLEPEGFDGKVIYPQGMSMTMPEEYQQKIINSIPGLEHARILRPGYGVEYDFVDPRQLLPTLETKPIKNLFFAGQINGTTGYEEAAAQGIVAGINAACNVQNKPPFIISRTEGYIGVMIDDLTTQGATEPYRIFTSRVEHRIVLRPDNADTRLTERGRQCGVVRDERWTRFCSVKNQIEQVSNALQSVRMRWKDWNAVLTASASSSGTAESFSDDAGDLLKSTDKHQLFSQVTQANAYDLLRTPVVCTRVLLRAVAEHSERCSSDVRSLLLHLAGANDAGSEQMRVRLKADAIYSSAEKKQHCMISSVQRSESVAVPYNIDYFDTRLNISMESRERLARAQPVTLGAASRLPGISFDTLLAFKSYVDRFCNVGEQPVLPAQAEASA